jgi:hypothetical protein
LDSVSFVNTGPKTLRHVNLGFGREQPAASLEALPPYRELEVPIAIPDYRSRHVRLSFEVDGRAVNLPGWPSPAPASLDRTKPYNLRIRISPDGMIQQDLERVEVLRARLHAAAHPTE